MKNRIEKITLILSGIALLFAIIIESTGCTKQSQLKTDMQDQRIIELTIVYKETAIYVNTHYIITIEPYTYYNDIKSVTTVKGERVGETSEGSAVYLNENKCIQVKESPEEILKLAKSY